MVLPFPLEYWRLQTLVALEDVVDGAYEDTLALLHGKERSVSRKEFSALPWPRWKRSGRLAK